MIYQRFGELYKQLILDTDNNKLHWIKFSNFKSRYMSSANVLETPLLAYFFNMENVCWGGKINYETSFYTKKNSDFLFLIDFFPPCSPKDGTPPEKERVLQLIGGSLLLQDDVIIFPDYTTDNFQSLLESVIKYRTGLGVECYNDEGAVANSLDFMYGFITN